MRTSTKERIIIATLPSGMFGNGGQSWLSLNVDVIKEVLVNNGFDVLVMSIDELPRLEVRETDYLFYMSSDNDVIRNYLKDLLFLLDKECTLIPPYQFLLAHENKGFQQLFRDRYSIGNLRGRYHYDYDALPDTFPYVFKTIDGAGSSGVHLIKSYLDRKRIHWKFFGKSLARKVKLLHRKSVLSKYQFSLYNYRHKGFKQYVVQEFIDGLDCDYKVLIFSGKFYVMKRLVRENDFRASGSKMFEFDEDVPQNLLDFSEDLFFKFNVPWISMDIAIRNGHCHLIEYQALNFGSTALRKSSHYYVRSDSGLWDRLAFDSELSNSFAASLCKYIEDLRLKRDPSRIRS